MNVGAWVALGFQTRDSVTPESEFADVVSITASDGRLNVKLNHRLLSLAQPDGNVRDGVRFTEAMIVDNDTIGISYVAVRGKRPGTPSGGTAVVNNAPSTPSGGAVIE